MATKTPVTVIGIGDDGHPSLHPHAIEAIHAADVLVGGERHLEFFPEVFSERWVFKGGLLSIIEKIRKAAKDGKQVAVLASGDPMFFGVGGLLASKLGKETVTIIPHFSSIQLAFARMKESSNDAHIDSVHGRPMLGLAQRIDGEEKVALLTDNENTPSVIAKYLLSYGMEEYDAFVAERLDSKEERCRWFRLDELARETEIDPLNVVILRRKQGVVPRTWTVGIPDEEFIQRKPDKGLITKKEVRVISLAELNLQKDSIVWDIGTCTGSIAVEAAKLAPYGQIYAVEKNEADLENARANAYKFRTDITFVHAKAPAGLDSFPDPDAVFIGGSGGELPELLAQCAGRLRENGRIVLNAVTIENLYEAMQAAKSLGLDVSVTMVSVARSKPILHLTRLEGLNPVYIITMKKAMPEAAEETAQDA
ncbi:precorrin-6y C5,15-methyltransferase (decarboxylating) subunit CbiE [Brevibacillus dissolubilis]|uniref:precorrin-6y C5,15-methyltransferase (decarboxylating) subunit CbiE n=1 Tax=Brevibacillus dissolubilis TaxID=1844116 RepID=UPI0011173ADA|nr:precorrin-6y C5,15-methyltransferase (decarboxylating) subunit CbiE [Brevibacillus dissolubilis]